MEVFTRASKLLLKRNRVSHFKTIFIRAIFLLLLTFAGVGFVVFASDPDTSVEDEQDTKTDDTLESANSTAENDVPQDDEELFEELLAFQRLLEENDESNAGYSDDTRCVDSRRMRHYDVLSGRFVSIEMRHSNEIYLIQFDQKCPGLQKNDSLTFDLRSGQSGRLCVDDHVKPLDGNLSSHPGMRGGNCRIPALERITKVQLLQLERGLASNRVE